MRPWIGNLFSARRAGTSAARSKPWPRRVFYRPAIESLETRLAPATATQVFGDLTFSYTVSNGNVLAADGTLESTTLPVTVGITQPGGGEGSQNNIPVLSLAGGVTLTLGAGGILPGPPPASGQPTTGANGLVSFTSGATGPVTEVLDGNNTQLLTSAAHTFDAAALLGSEGTSFSATEVTPVEIPDTVVVTPAPMPSYIKANASLVIDTGSAQETVTVSAVTATTFTATFANQHQSGFSIGDASNPAAPTTTANQAISGTQSFDFEDVAIAGPSTDPVLNLFSSGSGIVNSDNTVSFAQYAGPLQPASASLVPLAANSYVQFSNAGPLVLGPNTGNWSWAPSDNVNFSLGSSALFTTTGFVASYDADAKQLTASGAGILFANFNKAATLTAAVQPEATSIDVTGWNIADASLPYQIRIDSEDLIVDSATKQADGSYQLAVERAQYGTTADTHAASVAVIGGINALLGGAATTTAVSSPGMIVTNNVLTLFELTVVNNAPITLTSAFSITPTFLQFTYSQTTDNDGTHNVFDIAGAASFSYTTDTSSGTLALALGAIGSPGIVIQDGVLQSLNASISDTSADGIKIGGAQLLNSSLSLDYEPADATYVISGSTELQLPKAENPVTVSGSISVVSGVLNAFSLSVEAGASFTFHGATFTANSLAFSYTRDTATITLSGDAGLVFTIGGQQQSVDVALGDGADTPGMVIQSGELQSLNATVTANFTMKGLKVAINQLTVAYDKADDSFTLDGSVGVSTTAFNLSATFGDGGDNHGIVINNGALKSLYIVANGGFSLYGLNLQATAVTIAYDVDHDELKLSGGVTVALTSKFSFSAAIDSSTPLFINTQTGDFSIPNGLDISGSLKIGTVISAAVTVNYTPHDSTFDLSVTGQVTIANQFTVAGKFSLKDGQLDSIALSYSNSTGIAIGATGLFLSGLSGEVDNITDPSQISVSGSLTVYGMGALRIKGYSFITASGSFTVNASELKLTGDVSLVGGILGSGHAVVDINWGAGVYTISAQISLFDGIVNFNGLLSFDNQGDVTISAMAGINIPDGVPFIGGDTLASINFYLQVRPNEPDSDSFVAAWTTFTIPVVDKTVGIGFKYDFDNNLTILSGPPPEAQPTPPKTLTVHGPDLADAINSANDYKGSTIIQFAAGLQNIALDAPLPAIKSQDVTIVGPGANQLTIDGRGSNQVFMIGAGANVSISGLTITGGNAANGGGILNNGTLRLSNDTISGNSATSSGGGIYNTGTLSLSNCTVLGNTADQLAGGIYSTGSLSLTFATVVTNTAKAPTPNAPDIDGTVTSDSIRNVIGVGDSNLSGISDGDANNNRVGTAANPINPFVFTVNVASDSSNGTGSGQTGDLRYCVTQANSAGATNNGLPLTIKFDPSLGGQTITLTDGTLAVGIPTPAFPLALSTITIDGGGAVTVSGGAQFAVFQTGGAAPVVLTGLTITDGSYGGYGGINNGGTLTVTNCTISGNKGSGIFNGGTVTVTNCTIDNNSTPYEGGGINNGGTMAVTDCTIDGNSSNSTFSGGGGIYNIGTLSLSNSSISGNSAKSGAGIFNQYATLTLMNDTISGNSASGSGGGIFNSGTVSVSNSTLTGNAAPDGAGILNAAPPAGTNNKTILTVNGCTISGNDGTGSGPGIDNQTGSTLTLNNTIVAGNAPGRKNADVNGSVGGSQNLIGIGTGTVGAETGLTGGVNGNHVGTQTSPIDPKLGPLTDNGGSTQTMALTPGSPAIGAGATTAALDTVAFDAGAGATTIVVNASAAIAPGQTIVIGNQELQVTNVTQASFGTITIDSLGDPVSAGDTVEVLVGGSGGHYTPFTQMAFGADVRATTLVVNPFSASKLAQGDHIRIDLPPPGDTFALVEGVNASTTYNVLTVSSPLPAGVKSGDSVLGTDQRGALRPLATASDIGAYQTQTFTVNVATDTGATGVGSGSGNQGDLRYCVAQANTEVAFGLGIASTIQFAASLNGKTITLQNPLEFVSGGGLTTIDGAGHVTISGGSTTGVFQIDAGAQVPRVDLTGLTITGGKASQGAAINNAGTLTLTNDTLSGNAASSEGGGIYNTGTLTLTDDILSGNSAAIKGGGIFNAGTLTLTGGTLSGNSASTRAIGKGSGGGIYNSGILTLTNDTISGSYAGFLGSGIYNSGTATLTTDTISGNSGSISGGGVYNSGTLTLTDGTISGNSAKAGAGIFNSGTLSVSSSTISDNSASLDGGGINNGGELTVTRSTFAGNSARNGGALWNAAGTLALSNSTIANNTASLVGGGIDNKATLTLQNTIVASNTATTSAPDIAGSASGGYNLIGDGTKMTGISNGDASHNHVGTSGSPIDPRLGPLADNGGSTETMALLPGSSAIGAGPSSNLVTLQGNTTKGSNIVSGFSSTSALSVGMLVAGAGIPIDDAIAAIDPIAGEIALNAPATATGTVGLTFAVPDQRGAPVPTSAPDIGAYQTQVFVVTTNSDSIAGVGSGFTGDLRYCVALANADVAIGISATITFAPGLAGKTITLQNGPLELTDATASTTIDGADQGITISGANFVTLQGHTTSGSTIVSGLRSTSALSVGMRVNGAGIPLDATIAALGPNAALKLTADEIQLSDPATATATVPLAFGATGSVFKIDAGTEVALNGLTISNGNGAEGGGIDNAGTLTLTNDTISGNFANSGGGIHNAGALTLSNTTIKGNSSISGTQISNVGAGTIKGPVNVGLATPSISLQPVNITYGTALANSQLHGTARSTVGGLTVLVTGTFTYTSAAGTVPGAGNGQSANVTFTPTDTAHYAPVTATVIVNVSKSNTSGGSTPQIVVGPGTAIFQAEGVVLTALKIADLLRGVHLSQVQKLYRTLVGTLPPARSLASWVAALDAGRSLASVAQAIVHTPEFSLRLVTDIYRQYVGRTATAAELRSLLSLARSGRFDRVRASVLGSAAYFKQRAHNSNARFLNVLAADVLGRKLDAPTKATLAAKLARGVTRSDVARTLLASPSAKTHIAQALAKKYGGARGASGANDLGATLMLGASEPDVILLLVLQRGLLETKPT